MYGHHTRNHPDQPFIAIKVGLVSEPVASQSIRPAHPIPGWAERLRSQKRIAKKSSTKSGKSLGQTVAVTSPDTLIEDAPNVSGLGKPLSTENIPNEKSIKKAETRAKKKAARKSAMATAKSIVRSTALAAALEIQQKIAQAKRQQTQANSNFSLEVKDGKACFLCGAKMTKDHMAKHRNLKRSIVDSKTIERQNSGPASIWAVSGGLPSLGKRSR